MKQYLFSIIAAGILCAIISLRFKNDNTTGRLIRLICGIYMTLTVISPWKSFELSSIEDLLEPDTNQKDEIIAEGEQYAEETYRNVITEQCRTYIVEKANTMGVNIDAEVALNQGNPPTPCAVTITGSVPPYAQLRLEEIITQDLGIPKEQQTWK